MTPEQRTLALRAGEAAAEFYEQHPFETARLQIHALWAKAQTPEARESLWSELQALARVHGVLVAAAQNAQVAAMEIKAEQAVSEVDQYEHP